MRRFVILVTGLVLILFPAGVVSAAGPPEGPVHIALGDSQAFGFGLPVPEHLGYVAVLDRWAHALDCRDGRPAACPRLELVNLSVPGAKSPDLIATQLEPALQLITERNGDADPGNDVILITVTIGGNDLFRPVVDNCSTGPTPACVQAIASVFTSYAANLVQILGQLRAAAGPETQIVVMTYDNPLGACFLAPLEPFGDIVLEGGPGLAVGFNDIIRNVAAATSVEVADTFGQLDLDDWVGGQDCTHPDISGHHKIANIFEAVIS
jgi:lysophospholipase L1-like esterase